MSDTLKIKCSEIEIEIVSNDLFDDHSADNDYKDLNPNIRKLIDEITDKFSNSNALKQKKLSG